jgi:uncharacterized protein YaaN involved in tellurite resistance
MQCITSQDIQEKDMDRILNKLLADEQALARDIEKVDEQYHEAFKAGHRELAGAYAIAERVLLDKLLAVQALIRFVKG